MPGVIKIFIRQLDKSKEKLAKYNPSRLTQMKDSVDVFFFTFIDKHIFVDTSIWRVILYRIQKNQLEILG